MSLPADTTIRPAAVTDAPALGRLWWLTFADKFGPAFGHDATRNVALLTAMHRIGDGRMMRATVVAEGALGLAGFLLMHTGREGIAEFPRVEGWRVLRSHLGIRSALRAVLVLAVMEVGHPGRRRDRVVVALVGVDPAWRRRGIGRALMEAAIDRARMTGARAVSLEVVWGNTAARRLYDGLGFTPVLSRRSRVMQRLVGHPGWTRMVLSLEERPRAQTGLAERTQR
jgi:ribosomal protein S18 acetylase RimI-like enzyme